MDATGVLRRWVAFNAVGALGVGIQLAVLAVLVHGAGVHFLVATLVAVEAAILHNFAWHQRWTWKDRGAASRLAALSRLGKFNLLNGGISLVGNAVVMGLLTGVAGAEPVIANVAAIVLCSIANFVASETLVFKSAGIAAVVTVLALPAAVSAGPGPDAVSGWKSYVGAVDARFLASSSAGPFFTHDRSSEQAGWREIVKSGRVAMMELAAPSIVGGHIHHWIGAVFVGGTTVEDVVGRLQRNAGAEAKFFDDVLSSRLVSGDGDRAVVFMKLKRESIMTVTYNTEHDVVYRRLGRGRATSRSVATRIAELSGAGTPREREKTADEDNGFLWRLNAYWRYEQAEGGVVIECESVSLSRSIPRLLRPFVTSTVDRIARESLEKTLRSVRAFLVKRTS